MIDKLRRNKNNGSRQFILSGAIIVCLSLRGWWRLGGIASPYGNVVAEVSVVVDPNVAAVFTIVPTDSIVCRNVVVGRCTGFCGFNSSEFAFVIMIWAGRCKHDVCEFTVVV